MAGNPITRGRFEDHFWLRLRDFVGRGVVPMTVEELDRLEELERDGPWGGEGTVVGSNPLEELLPEDVRHLRPEVFDAEDAVDPFPRRSVWDPLRACRLLEAVRRGADAELLVRLTGIDSADRRAWLAAGVSHGHAGREDHPLAIFARAYAESEALVEMNLQGRVMQAARGDWRAGAWWLERRRPEKYGTVGEKAKHVALRRLGGLTAEEAAVERDRLLAEGEESE